MSRRPALPWLTLAALVVCVLYVAVVELGATAYDDSYFFKRIAANALGTGAFAWNVQDGPVHVSTSQAYQGLVTVVTAFTTRHYVATMRLLNAALLTGAGWLLLRPATQARPLLLAAFVTPLTLTTVLSGMETALALAVLAVVVTAWMKTRRIEGITGAVATVAVYLVRPDAALIVALLVLGRAAAERRWPVRYAFALLVGMAAVWGACWLYYGTPLPLSFYMKSLGLHDYGASTAEPGMRAKRSHALVFAWFAAPLAFEIVRSKPWSRRDDLAALALAAMAFIAYHLAGTHEIMGYRARFYLPAIVPLVAAARLAVERTEPTKRRGWGFLLVWGALGVLAYRQHWIPTSAGFFTATVPAEAYAAAFGAATAGLLRRVWSPTAAGLAVIAGVTLWIPPHAPALRDDATVMRRHVRETTSIRGVFAVRRCLPPQSTVYHSEMGVPGLVLFSMRLVDLVGIVSPQLGIEGQSFEDLCRAERPEAIFLPHKGYRELAASVRDSACLQNYVRVVKRSSSPLHVRADLHPAFAACAGPLP